MPEAVFELVEEVVVGAEELLAGVGLEGLEVLLFWYALAPYEPSPYVAA